jgi:hypothetical protein
MAFDTDGTVEETADASTTSFTRKSANTEYSDQEASKTASVGSTPGDSSDEVDPRRLMEDPSISDIRWLYRGSLAQTLVNKPIDDVFKNGFKVKTEEDNPEFRNILDEHEWVKHYKLVQKKARRDGFALTYFILEDDSDGVWEDPMDESVNVRGVHKLEALTLDDLSRYRSSPTSGVRPSIEEATGHEYDEYEIRRTGIVVDTDPSSQTYKEPLGYLVGPDQFNGNHDQVKFIHRNRIQHHVWNPEVDAELDDNTFGKYEGDSVLVSSYHILRGLKKGNWSIMQTLFRYAAKLYHVELPEDADEDDFDEATNQLQNMNAKGEIITPSGYEVQDFQTDGQLDPEEYFDVLFKQVCASNEMTKSVLFGTQSGTVSGSETDIKNYFNKVERMRHERVERDMRGFVRQYKILVDGRASEQYEAPFDVEWGPLFKLSELDQVEALSRKMGVLTAAINSFIMTPQEARNVLQEDWADAEIDWQDEFSEDEEQFLQTLNMAQQGAETAEEKAEAETSGASAEGASDPDEGSTQQQNGGGATGQRTSAQPNSDDLSGESPDSVESRQASPNDIDRLAEAVVQRIESRDEPRYEF